MSIPRHQVEEILARTDLVELVGRTVTLRRSGRSYTGLCPFHQEKTPSFHVIPQKGIYHCFGCGEGGDAVAWLRKTRGMSFVEAVKDLASMVGVVVEERQVSPEERQRMAKRVDLYALCEAAAVWFQRVLLTAPEGAPGRAYLEQRGITLDTAEKYRLGYAPEGWQNLATVLEGQGFPLERALESGLVKRGDRGRVYDLFRHRVVFPILDDRERPIAFGGRLLAGEGPKYLNSPESPVYVKSRELYGLSWARGAAQRKDRLILVEGYFDAVSLWQAGFAEVVATCGTAFTPQHAEVVRRITRRVVALFDTDEAGLRAATKAMEVFLAAELSATRLDLSPAKDPDEFVQQQGAAAFEQRLAQGEPLVDLVIRRTLAKEGTDPGAQARALTTLITILRPLPATVRQPLVLRIAGQLNVREDELLRRIGAPVEAAPPPTPAPSRWVPTRELSHLLWLVIHFPQEVGPIVGESDPDLLSDRPDVLRAVHDLVMGSPLAVVADALDDPELARILRRIAAQDAAYTADTAATATGDLLSRLELPRIEAKLRIVNTELAAAYGRGPGATGPSVADLKVELSRLNARRLELEQRIRRSPR